MTMQAGKKIDGTWHVYFKQGSLQSQTGKPCKDPYQTSNKNQEGAPVRLYVDSGLSIGIKNLDRHNRYKACCRLHDSWNAESKREA